MEYSESLFHLQGLSVSLTLEQSWANFKAQRGWSACKGHSTWEVKGKRGAGTIRDWVQPAGSLSHLVYVRPTHYLA